MYLTTFLFFFFSCKKDKTDSSFQFTPYTPSIPHGFPNFPIPENNQLSEERIALGKKLFFDPILSRDSSISCASCHLPNLAFSDGLAISKGIDNRIGFRNSASLTNVAYQEFYLKEGGISELERQVTVPIEDDDEMGFTTLEAVRRLQVNSEYQKLSKIAYDREPDAFVITRALACFERTFLSGNSPFDQFHFQGNTMALTEQEKQGMQLFNAHCASCHSGFNFTNNGFENNGLLEEYADQGRFRITSLTEDIGKFKVPSLRNIAQTDPYMHNGSVNSLEEVIEHYNSGGSSHPNKSEQIQPLGLDSEEKAALIAFLQSLTDEDFLNNEAFYP